MSALVVIAGFLAAALGERVRPYRLPASPSALRWLGNLSVWLVNGAIVSAVASLGARSTIHLWPRGAAGLVAGFVALDLLSYWIHRAQHAVPSLWRLHALHHSDPDVDWTTALRNHPAETLTVAATYSGAMAALGIPAEVAAAYAMATLLLAVACHANIRWPMVLEGLCRPLLVSPNLHLLHHSVDPRHSNSNYGNVLTVWDRLFGTLQHPLDGAPVFGVAGLSRRDARRPIGMLLTPMRLNMYYDTHRLPDGREVETSWQIAGHRLRLRARLVDGVTVVHGLMRTYDAADLGARAAFQVEFEGLTRLAFGYSLFPEAVGARAAA